MSSTVPYIGSKISLVSNSDIRYEGILYTINTQESTIALQSVRCCGTEGRKVPEIPPSSEIYDFIIFRGQDIKDLTVLESANPALSAQLNDPAIMSVNQRPAGGAPAGAPGKSSPAFGGKGAASASGAGAGGWGGGWHKQDRAGGKADGKGGRGAGKGKAGDKGGTDKGATDKGGRGSSKGGKAGEGGRGYSKGGKAGEGGRGSSKGGKAGEGGKGPGRGGKAQGEAPGGRRGGGEGAAGGAPVGELPPSANEAERSKYAEEFDYDGENKKFEQTKKGVEGEEVDERLKPLAGYDKSKSFFDNISCEATDRAGDAERPRADRSKARQNDRETFGDTRRPPRPTAGRRGKGGRRGAPRGYRN